MKTKTGQIIFLIFSCIFLMILTYIICGCEEENPYHPYQATDIQEEGEFISDSLYYTWKTKFNSESDTLFHFRSLYKSVVEYRGDTCIIYWATSNYVK